MAVRTVESPSGWRGRLEQVKQARHALVGLPQTFALIWAAQRWLAIVLALLNVAQGLIPVSQAWVTKTVIDLIGTAVSGQTVAQTDVYQVVAFSAMVALAGTVIEPTSTLVQLQLGDHLKREIQVRILEKANSLADISYFENPDFYDRLQRAQGDSGYRPINVLRGAVEIFRSLVHLGSMLAVLLAFQPVLVLVAVALAVPSLVQQLNGQVKFWDLSNSTVPEVRRMRYFAELITGKDSAAETRLYGLGDFFLGRFRREFEAFHARMSGLRRKQAGWEASTAAVAELGSSVLYGWLVFQTLARRITLGEWSLLSQAVWQANGQIGGLVRQVSNLYSEILFVGQLFEFLETPPAMEVTAAGEGRETPRPLRAGIELREVTFRYPGTERAVLEKLNLRIEPGESVALVGENGAGKTTIVKLLTRLYDPTEGMILVDGEDLRAHDLEDWRKQNAAIFQDFSRYHLTARENIGLGDVTRLEEEAAIAGAAARGGAADVVSKLPAGYETVLGLWRIGANTKTIQDGTDISGGEWQKVALSRGFMRSGDDGEGAAACAGGEAEGDGDKSGAAPVGYSGAQLLILDEPTASLDTQSEYDVYRRFNELTKDKATLLISHRFSTVRMADRIVVLEEGRIIEEGTHAELIRLGGTYAELYEKQASRYR